MNKCRLKIISSNIINDIDNPEIKYVSQSNRPLLTIPYEDENIYNEENNEEELKEVHENNFTYSNKLDPINSYNMTNSKKENTEENENINRIEDIENIEEFINKKIENYINEETKNLDKKENKNIDSNELYTISNQHNYNDNFLNSINNNYNTISNSHYVELMSSSYNKDETPKKSTNLKFIFRKREKKNYISRSLSNNNHNLKGKNGNQKYNLIKDIFKTHPVNYNYNNLKVINQKKSTNKVGNILNININKSFCINNNIRINQKKIIQNRLKSNSNSKSKNISKNRSKESTLNNTKEFNDKKKEGIDEKNIMKKVKQLKFNKKNNKDKLNKGYYSWNIVENNDINIEETLDYKTLIDELIQKECNLIKEKENIIQTYEEKLKPLKKLNTELINNSNEEIDKEDELQGELVILKNQYETLFSKMNNNKKNESKNIQEKNIEKEFENRIQNIDQEMKDLNDNLKNGKILLITKPNYPIDISERDEKDIILMLKGLFYSIHIRNTDEIVDRIWNRDKEIQTIYFLVEELFKFLYLKNSEKNLIINFFYSFCKKFSYLDIDTFKSLFKQKIGNIQLYNKNMYISRLMNFHRRKINELIKLIKEKNTFNLGIISFEQFTKLLNKIGLFDENEKDLNEIYEFLIITMKKNRSLKLFKENSIRKKSEIKYSFFDLFYKSLIYFIDDFNSNIISNPFELIRNYMKKKDINNAEYLLKPLLENKYIIKINNKEYFDIVILNKYLRKLGIIKKNETISLNCFEEELIDKNKFIDDIYDFKINEINTEKINQNASNLINEIFQVYK